MINDDITTILNRNMNEVLPQNALVADFKQLILNRTQESFLCNGVS